MFPTQLSENVPRWAGVKGNIVPPPPRAGIPRMRPLRGLIPRDHHPQGEHIPNQNYTLTGNFDSLVNFDSLYNLILYT